jgi:hypothetical protein
MDARSARPKGIALTDRQRIAWLRLIRSDNVGPATFRDLINHFGSAEAALAALPGLSARGGATRAIRIATDSEALKVIDAPHTYGAGLVRIGEPGTAKTSLPNSPASRAVISEPDRVAASTTTVPSVMPAISLLRLGKSRARGSQPNGI